MIDAESKKTPMAGWFWSRMKGLKFSSVFVPFSGRANLALMFKESGKEVTVTDVRLSPFRFGRALIENDDTIIDPFDTDVFLADNRGSEGLLADSAAKFGISHEDALRLDMLRANIDKFEDPMKRDLAYCVVTKVIDYLFSIRGDLADVRQEDDLLPNVQYYIESFNEKIFPVKGNCLAYNDDANTMIFGLHSDAMVLYMPNAGGYGEMSDRAKFIEMFHNNCTEKELEKLCRKPVQGLGGRMESPEKYYAAVETFFDNAGHIPIWVVGASRDLPIPPEEIGGILGKFRKKVTSECKTIFHPAGDWVECLFVATD